MPAHVFVETNWVVDYCAPAHFKVPEAVELLSKAQRGSFTLHLPSICISEARNVIHRRFDPVKQIASFRKYLKWAKNVGNITLEDDTVVRRVLDSYQNTAVAEFSNIEADLGALLTTQGLEAFPMNEAMLNCSLRFSGEQLDLHPFDVSVLSAILTRADELKLQDRSSELFFCELDSDLQPWSSAGNYRPRLRELYDAAHVWVYGDYGMSSHDRPDDWPC
jgi:hypothetical protein